ncbi:HD domain-containing protein [Clostridiales bacterium FE2010]|nr:HD domain-containing protein [Clostridiales bacterium FE2010]
MEFARMKHEGQIRKGTTIPYFTHVMEAMEIVSRITKNEELRAAAVLHDTLEDTDTTKEELIEAFGQCVADLVAAESENKRKDQPEGETWLIRKSETIEHLREADTDIKMIALGDKLSNVRAMTRDYKVIGEKLWEKFNEKDPVKQGMYYGLLANVFGEDETLRKTPEYREYVELCAALFGKTYDGDGKLLDENEAEEGETAEDSEGELQIRFFFSDAVDELRSVLPEGTHFDALIFDRTEDEDIQEIQKMAATLDAFLRTEDTGFTDVHMQFINDPDSDDVSWRRTEDGYALHLCAESGKNWCQVAYQLGYLMMHCLIDHLNKDTEGISWAEELICETAALEVFSYLSAYWNDTPFGQEDPEYAKHLNEYVSDCLSDQGTSALLRCRDKEELKTINERNLFDDRLDESHDLYRAMCPGDLQNLAQVRKYEADDLLLDTHCWHSLSFGSRAVDYICRLQERIPGCEIPEGTTRENREDMKEEHDNPEENDSGIEYDDLNEFDIMEQILHPDGRENE